jgi:hypothetical protein
MSSKRREDHLTKLCATVEKALAGPIVRLGDAAIVYNIAGHREDALALLTVKKDLENIVDDFKIEAKQRYE